MVDREELQREMTEGTLLALPNLDQRRALAVLTAFRGQQREGELRSHYGQIRPQLEQEAPGHKVVLVAVGEHERLDVLQAMLDRPEVRQDQVDPWRVVLGKEH